MSMVGAVMGVALAMLRCIVTNAPSLSTMYRNAGMVRTRTTKAKANGRDLKVVEHLCDHCKTEWFVPRHSKARFCSDACRQAAYRKRKRNEK